MQKRVFLLVLRVQYMFYRLYECILVASSEAGVLVWGILPPSRIHHRDPRRDDKRIAIALERQICHFSVVSVFDFVNSSLFVEDFLVFVRSLSQIPVVVFL